MRGSLDDLTLFLAVVEHGNFRRAAGAVGLSPSAFSHAIRATESRLGVRLVERTTRSMRLTDAGVRLAERISPAMTTIGDALDELQNVAAIPSGRIRITTMEYGVKLLFQRRLSEFLDLFPGIEVEISVDTALLDLVGSGFDAGIRFRDDVPADMVAMSLAPDVAFVAVASPEYLARFPAPQRPADLLEHHCIRQRMRNGAIYRWSFEDGARNITIDPPGRLTVNSIDSTVVAAAQGAGIGFLPKHHVAEHVAAGSLIILLEQFSSSFEGHCLYYRANKQPTRAFAAFIDHMRRGAPRINGK
ncbi:hypothetical protein A8A54_19355 [Brucella pseudogrignonensis]|uniref:LysR family transcriptional regulator n=1 Tax=Brucella pseudogrignonensis TaxID=419475 RepID=UPI0007DA6EE3|nr:LysR family transcriptional regulator [Brucella pseudogrignonensis]ANG98760.1 hypothetical protein A8A54_19355 [Brucella pseudogrignonensis]